MKRNLYLGTAVVLLVAVLVVAYVARDRQPDVTAAAVQAPMFEVDLMWPKPLPNHWILGMTIGVAVDAQDNVWIVHRQGSLERMETYAQQDPVAGDCCIAAPPVLKFDPAGNLIGHWGGPGEGYEWPVSTHGITVDHKGNVWLGGNGSGAGGSQPVPTGPPDPEGYVPAAPYHDSMILKFSPDGKFLLQIGKAGQSKGSNDPNNVRGPAKIWIDAETNEVYVADGYGNKRVVVFDADTGQYKRHWGAYGNKPDDVNPEPYNPAAPVSQQFRRPVHCAVLSNDDLLYVCDRVNNRIQVFRPDGTFVKEKMYYPRTRGDGAIWDLAFSRDPQQKYMYASDGTNEKVHILDRETLEVLTSFGDGGRQPGQFYAVHSIATDSKGNLYTTETYRGQRVQRFIYKGLGPVTTMDQGVLWPGRTQ
jgi:DNA-binding beta-propeller fold protein YncE